MPSERNSTRSSRFSFCQTTALDLVSTGRRRAAFQPDDGLDVGSASEDRGRANRRTGACFFGARLLAHFGELLGAGVAMVGLASGEQLLGDLAMARGAAELVNDIAIPIEPSHFRPSMMASIPPWWSAAVGVLDRSSILPPRPRAEPVEQCGTRPADMQEAGRRRGKSCNDWIGHRLESAENLGEVTPYWRRAGCIAGTLYN